MILAIGGTQNIIADMLGPDLASIAFTDLVAWVSDRLDLVTVSPKPGDGGNTHARQLTGVAAGTAVVTATVAGLPSGTLFVQVVAAGTTLAILPG